MQIRLIIKHKYHYQNIQSAVLITGVQTEVEVEVDHYRPMGIPWKVRMGLESPRGFAQQILRLIYLFGNVS